MDILSQYDIIVDATDNVATRCRVSCVSLARPVGMCRYLLNDGCVLLRKPLVSGSALRFEGQLTVYGWRGGPCYRCLFPSPPPPDTVTNCSEGGVLGVGKSSLASGWPVMCVSVPGIIGSLQALETLKIASGMERIHITVLFPFH